MKRLPLVVNVRGNSGSGKTHLTRSFMDAARYWEAIRNERGKVTDYVLCFKSSPVPWVVIGKYENACGGCDTIKTQDEIVQRVELYALKRRCNVWLEGLIMSTIYGTVGQYSEKFGDRWVFAYLDTPLDVCLDRVQSRRDLVNNTKPFNQNNTIARHRTIVRNREIVEERGRRVVVLPWKSPLEPLMKIIKKEAN